MIHLKNTQDSFKTNVDIGRLSLSPLPVVKKPVDRRGYMYILTDSVYPDHVKIGRTNDPKKRLSSYNSDKPFNTASFVIISLPFVDVVNVERLILEELCKVIQPIGLKKEWFEIKHYDKIFDWIKKAEDGAKIHKE